MMDAVHRYEGTVNQVLGDGIMALFAASLPSHPDEAKEEVVLAGEVPSALNPPSGCHFHPRCPFAMPQCAATEPELVEVSRGHQVACHLYEPC
jgi:oligopeptide transport system ATP-binding protein